VKNPHPNGTTISFPSLEPPTAFQSPKKKPPALSGKTNSTADMVALLVPPRVENEVRALAIHAGTTYGRAVDYVCLLARDALWTGLDG
jgi:hypothetical protein